MDTTLKQLPLETDADIIIIHHFATQLASIAGLSPVERLSFSCRVAHHCFNACGKDEEISFSVHQLDDRIVMRASTKQTKGVVLSQVVRMIDEISIGSVTDAGANSFSEGADRTEIQQFPLALSHELKNSIAKIKLSVSLLEQYEVPGTVQTYLDVIHRASDKLEKTMTGLNDVIRFGYTSPVLTELSPENVFNDVKEDFADVLKEAGATVNSSFNNDIAVIRYVDVYLRSIISNVLSNAIKYAHPDRTLIIQVDGQRKEQFVYFCFKDNGSGMDMHTVREKLFHPFTRFSTKAEGSGLGLYLIKNMVERNGGRIEVESEPGNGTTFHFYLKEY